MENLFDDQDDPRDHDAMEDWFAHDPPALRAKLGLLADALLRQNGGRGPDILALVEVENERAVELLRQTLNERLSAEWQYPARGLVHRDNTTGRRIEPAILTRLPVLDDRTRGPHDFQNRRILEAHLQADGAPLVVLVSHWTSRVREDTVSKRAAYADVLYGLFLDLRREDPEVDLLMSGDFNDEPSDPSVRDHLHAVSDPTRIRAADARPQLLDLDADRDPARGGTYFYHGRWQILDHIVLSPGLLDRSGWQLVPDSLRVENDFRLRATTDRSPHRFGNEKNPNPRGPSDHFAVTVRLRVKDQTPALQ